jgi:hypothetical protein
MITLEADIPVGTDKRDKNVLDLIPTNRKRASFRVDPMDVRFRAEPIG